MSDELEQKDGVTDPKNAEASTGTGSQASAGSGSGSGTQPGYVTEESYKGLQTAMNKQKTKLENELAALKQKLETSAAELEEAKIAVAEKTKLETAQNELNTSIQSLQAERDRLTRQLNQQQIVLAKFPELAPLASYIPTAESDEAFEANAQNFQAALQQYVRLTIKGTFEGANPPVSSGNGSGGSELIDKLWNETYKYAGIAGKEVEYEEAYAKLQEALKSQ